MEQVVGEFQILESKKLLVIFLLMLFSSCSESQSNNKNIAPTEEKVVANASDSSITRNAFVPDSTINNSLKLTDPSSLNNFFNGNTVLVDRLRESPVLIFCNGDKSEYLLAYQYEGATKYAFSCFEIGHTNDTILESKFADMDIKDFSTESGIKLGLPFELLVARKGSDYDVSGQDSVITYRLDINSSFVERYNMPGYFLQCAIQNGKVDRIKFGFDYP